MASSHLFLLSPISPSWDVCPVLCLQRSWISQPSAQVLPLPLPMHSDSGKNVKNTQSIYKIPEGYQLVENRYWISAGMYRPFHSFYRQLLMGDLAESRLSCLVQHRTLSLIWQLLGRTEALKGDPSELKVKFPSVGSNWVLGKSLEVWFLCLLRGDSVNYACFQNCWES